eukprot:6064287-Amphidinium_carterae.1
MNGCSVKLKRSQANADSTFRCGQLTTPGQILVSEATCAAMATQDVHTEHCQVSQVASALTCQSCGRT